MYEIYMVRDGDTLESIADMYGASVGILRQINGFLDEYRVRPGDQIVVPKKMKQPYQYYTVQKGDNMYDIAMKNNIDYFLLLQLNGLDDGDYIYPNQTIMLPKNGIGIYMTKSDDTLEYVLRRLNISADDLLNENEFVYLRPEQILFFSEK